MSFEEYKKEFINYLQKEKELIERDILLHQSLSDDEKVELGYLVKDCKIIETLGNEYTLKVCDNNSKLRAGDKVILKGGLSIVNATIIENFFDLITLSANVKLSVTQSYDIHVTEAYVNSIFIQLYDKLSEVSFGSYFFKTLFLGETPIKERKALAFDNKDIASFNEKQQEAIIRTTKRPSVYCIQGPPGTGKTAVLAQIAMLYSKKGKDVLLVSNTHQAVNNAINEVASLDVPAIKIGEDLKAQELSIKP